MVIDALAFCLTRLGVSLRHSLETAPTKLEESRLVREEKKGGNDEACGRQAHYSSLRKSNTQPCASDFSLADQPWGR